MLSMASPIVSSSADFSIFNTGWNGTSGLAISVYQSGKFSPSFELRSTGSEVDFVRFGLEDLELDPSSDALAIIGPTKAFSEAEGLLVGDFVRSGGNVLIADDFGSGNSLLESIGAESRFSGKLVMDLCFDKSPEFPICYDILPDALTANVTSIQLNYASSLSLGNLSEPLAYTSLASWSDTDGDRMEDFSEPKGPFAVLARERLGVGEVILLSDPSLLTNGMRDHLDNEMLSSNLLMIMGEGRSSFYFDESHRDYFDPVAVSTEITGTVSGNAKVALFFIAFILALWIATDLVDRAWLRARRGVGYAYGFIIGGLLRRRARRPGSEMRSPEEIAEELSASNPELRRGMIRYVIKEKQRHDAHVERHS